MRPMGSSEARISDEKSEEGLFAFFILVTKKILFTFLNVNNHLKDILLCYLIFEVYNHDAENMQ